MHCVYPSFYRPDIRGKREMKEYQIVHDKEFVLPREVYHQCIWIVRDMGRMESELNRMSGMIVRDGTGGNAYQDGTPAEIKAAEMYRLRLNAIKQALLEIPKEYRAGVLNSIVNRGSTYSDLAHENTWKRWKQRFVFYLAKNLGIY